MQQRGEPKMKANEFVKKFGLFTAKEYLAGSTIFDNHLMVFTNDCELKRLVESHELVESFGGINACHETLYMLHELTENPEPIREALADVESCYD